MINIKIKAHGNKPNVTEFEASIALKYLDRKRDSKLNFARKLLADRVDEEIISCNTKFSIEDL